jgi:hypothetical protein
MHRKGNGSSVMFDKFGSYAIQMEIDRAKRRPPGVICRYRFKRKCRSCNQIKPPDSRPMSASWICADCRRAKEATDAAGQA